MDVDSTRGARRTSAPNRRAFWEEWAREALECGKVPPLPRGISREHLNVPLCEGVTPLIMAVKLKHYRACVRIVRAGADIDLHDLEEKTPLIHAVETTQSDIVEFLLHKGCDPFKAWSTVHYYDLVLFPGNTFGRFAPIFGWFGATGSPSAGEHPSPAQEGSSEEQAGQLAASLKGARALSNARHGGWLGLPRCTGLGPGTKARRRSAGSAC